MIKIFCIEYYYKDKEYTFKRIVRVNKNEEDIREYIVDHFKTCFPDHIVKRTYFEEGLYSDTRM